MALQKRRLGKSRIRNRRSAWMRSQSNAPSLSKCVECGAPKLAHRICEACGHHRKLEKKGKDTVVVSIEVKSDATDDE